MSVYTVHEPPRKRHDHAGDPEQLVFVRDGFSFWAFLLGYVLVIVALEMGLSSLGASAVVKFPLGFLLALLIGFEAATLRRFTLERRHWTNVGVVVADDLEAAERRFFDAWVRSSGVTAPALAEAPARQPPATPEVIGLFPQQGPCR